MLLILTAVAIVLKKKKKVAIRGEKGYTEIFIHRVFHHFIPLKTSTGTLSTTSVAFHITLPLQCCLGISVDLVLWKPKQREADNAGGVSGCRRCIMPSCATPCAVTAFIR